jgi:hypothetical protein
MASPVLTPGTVPGDLSLPANMQQLINAAAAYLSVAGLDNLEGVIISETEPDTTQRDLAWIKQDPASGRAIGLYVYVGAWTQVPVVVGSGTAEPSNAQAGELFYRTDLNCIEAYVGGAWTTELWAKGPTTSRPATPAVGYVYYDTTINRLLRYTSQGWSTVDGSIGEVKMLTGLTEDQATANNPGWNIDYSFGGRVPIGEDGVTGDYTIGTQGGQESISWSASGNSAQGGSRDTALVGNLTINGQAVNPATGNGNGNTVNNSFDILPPYKVVIFMTKAF